MSDSAAIWIIAHQASLFRWDFPGGTVVKNLPANAGDARVMGSIPELGRYPGEGNGNPL